jgi:hypothetical protein
MYYAISFAASTNMVLTVSTYLMLMLYCFVLFTEKKISVLVVRTLAPQSAWTYVCWCWALSSAICVIAMSVIRRGKFSFWTVPKRLNQTKPSHVMQRAMTHITVIYLALHAVRPSAMVNEVHPCITLFVVVTWVRISTCVLFSDYVTYFMHALLHKEPIYGLMHTMSHRNAVPFAPHAWGAPMLEVVLLRVVPWWICVNLFCVTAIHAMIWSCVFPIMLATSYNSTTVLHHSVRKTSSLGFVFVDFIADRVHSCASRKPRTPCTHSNEKVN